MITEPSVKQSGLIRQFAKWGPDYRISFELELVDDQMNANANYNLLGMVYLRNKSDDGTRVHVPGVYVKKSGNKISMKIKNSPERDPNTPDTDTDTDTESY